MNQTDEQLNTGVWTMFEGNAYTRIRDGSTLCLQTERQESAEIVAKLLLLTGNGWEVLYRVSEGINNPGFHYDQAHAQKRLAEVKDHGELVKRLMQYAALLYGDRLYKADGTEVAEADYNLVGNRMQSL